MTSRPVSSCGSSTWRPRPTTTGGPAARHQAAASSTTLRCSSRSWKVRAAHEFAATYGSPRVWLELRRQGVRVGRKRVERLMRTHGLQGAHLRRGWRHGSTRQNPSHTAAPDLVDRDFHATEPNRLWVADLTQLVTGEGVLWLASVRDAFANRIVGWATDPRATTTLVLTALNTVQPRRRRRYRPWISASRINLATRLWLTTVPSPSVSSACTRGQP